MRTRMNNAKMNSRRKKERRKYETAAQQKLWQDFCALGNLRGMVTKYDRVQLEIQMAQFFAIFEAQSAYKMNQIVKMHFEIGTLQFGSKFNKNIPSQIFPSNFIQFLNFH